jgi:circadian clock protein KaiC
MVRSMETKRVSTGILGLDALLQGGLLPTRSYLLTGEAGTGKTTACMQFLLSGLIQGQKAVYVTVDERPTEILQAAASLGWDLQRYVHEKSLVILDASPYFSGRAGTNGEKGVDLPKIVSDLSGYAKRMQAARLVIDPVTPMILDGDAPARVHECARALVHLLQSNLTTTNLFTSHLPRRSDQDPTNGIEEYLASGIFVLATKKVADRFVRTLYVKKMRGTAIDPNEYPFEIAAGKGINIMLTSHPAVLDCEAAFQALEFFELSKAEMEKDPSAS